MDEPPSDNVTVRLSILVQKLITKSMTDQLPRDDVIVVGNAWTSENDEMKGIAVPISKLGNFANDELAHVNRGRFRRACDDVIAFLEFLTALRRHGSALWSSFPFKTA